MALELSDEVISCLRSLLLVRKVIFFRDQGHVTREQHLAFGSRFGELEVHPFSAPVEGYPQILQIAHDKRFPGQENNWHSDVTFREAPSLGSILICRECPPHGGDTLFSDSYAAFKGLPPSLAARLRGTEAVHDWHNFRKVQRIAGVSESTLSEMARDVPWDVVHPTIRTHPETGKEALYVNIAFVKQLVGFEPEESQRLLAFLFEQHSFPEFQCRFSWKQGSVAFWDNRACQHYASADYYPLRRVVERVTVCGDRPFYSPPASSKL